MQRHRAGLAQATVLGYFRRFYYETALASGQQSLACVKEVADPGRILFGSDWPYCPDAVIQARLDSNLFTPAQQAAINQDNTRALFPRYYA